MYRITLLILGVGLITLGVAGCQRRLGNEKIEEVLVVPVAHPEKRLVADYAYYTGRTNAMYSVPFSRASRAIWMNAVQRRGIRQEGRRCCSRSIRVLIRPNTRRRGPGAQSKASLEYATATYKRFKELDKKSKGNVSQRELDQYKAQEEQAVANLELAKANLESAKLNLEWTEIRSPIAGHISRYYLTSATSSTRTRRS